MLGKNFRWTLEGQNKNMFKDLKRLCINALIKTVKTVEQSNENNLRRERI